MQRSRVLAPDSRCWFANSQPRRAHDSASSYSAASRCTRTIWRRMDTRFSSSRITAWRSQIAAHDSTVPWPRQRRPSGQFAGELAHRLNHFRVFTQRAGRDIQRLTDDPLAADIIALLSQQARIVAQQQRQSRMIGRPCFRAISRISRYERSASSNRFAARWLRSSSKENEGPQQFDLVLLIERVNDHLQRWRLPPDRRTLRRSSQFPPSGSRGAFFRASGDER